MSEKVKSIILRFRDLVTTSGDTITEHKQLIKTTAKKYVWWGWWSKAGEKVPYSIFVELNKIAARSEGFQLLLLDTGNDILYRAVCKEIKFSADGSRMGSPGKAYTPKYYRTQEYLAWFKFTDLDSKATDSSELKHYSYVEIKDFFQAGESHFHEFHGKVIASAKELRHQDRTIWFARESKEKDPSHEILLIGSPTTQVSHFSEHFKSTPRTDILWLSDLHFGNQSFPSRKTATQRPMWLALESAIAKLNLNISSVIVSGDLTWCWHKVLKWLIVCGGTVGLYYSVGHIALVFPFSAAVIGTAVHFWWCRKHNIDPIHATPRRRYYELRGWDWPDEYLNYLSL